MIDKSSFFSHDNPAKGAFDAYLKSIPDDERKDWMKINNLKHVIGNLVIPASNNAYGEVPSYCKFTRNFTEQLQEMITKDQFNQPAILPSELSYKDYVHLLNMYKIVSVGEEYGYISHSRVCDYLLCIGGFKGIKDGKLVFNNVNRSDMDAHTIVNVTANYLYNKLPTYNYYSRFKLIKFIAYTQLNYSDVSELGNITGFKLNQIIMTTLREEELEFYKGVYLSLVEFIFRSKVIKSPVANSFNYLYNKEFIGLLTDISNSYNLLPSDLQIDSHLSDLIFYIDEVLDTAGRVEGTRVAPMISHLNELLYKANDYKAFVLPLSDLIKKSITWIDTYDNLQGSDEMDF